jgi:hypothetical protein
MQFGVCDIAVDPTDQFLELVRHMEESGWDYLWVVDCVLHSRVSRRFPAPFDDGGEADVAARVRTLQGGHDVTGR